MKYEDRIIAFVDILGFKEKVNRSVSDAVENEKIYRALKQILRRKELLDKDNETGLNFQDVRITTFSDSAVISYPLELGKGNLFSILLDLIHLQIDLLQMDVLLRGGVTVGKLCHEQDGAIVYGPAMNEAYTLESTRAKYPRIIITKDVVEECLEKTCSSFNSITDECEYVCSLLREDREDGFLYLDYLSQSQELNFPEIDYYIILSNIRKVIINGMCHNNIAVQKKYKWLREYFNDVVMHGSHPVIEEKTIEESMIEYLGLIVH